MTVIRNHRDRHFTVVPNDVLRDPALSLQAKGLLALMLSYPDDWQYSLGHLQGLSSNGRDAHRAALRELEEKGYARRVPIRGEDGTLAGSELVISDEPMTDGEGPDQGATSEGFTEADLAECGEASLATDNPHSQAEEPDRAPGIPQDRAPGNPQAPETPSRQGRAPADTPAGNPTHRAPENPSLGATERLKSRPSGNPTVGKPDGRETRSYEY